MPVALVEDCFDVVFTLSGTSNLTKIAIAGDIDLKIPGNKGRLASSLTMESTALLQVLQNMKQASGPDADKLSMLYGILCNNILAAMMKPVYDKHASELEELMIYHDSFMLRSLARDEADKVQRAYLEKMLKELLPRTVTRVHTLIPDTQDSMDWVVKMTSWRKKNFELMEKYANIYTNPDQNKLQKFVYADNLYNPDDPLIHSARNIQQGMLVEDKKLNQLLASENSNNSLYCRALSAGIKCIIKVDDYLQDKTNDQNLIQLLTSNKAV